MCGRYALALRPAQVRAYLENAHMPVYEAPADDDDEGGPRQSYNFAPGYHGLVYRADTPDWGAGPRVHGKSGSGSAGDAEPEDEVVDDEPEPEGDEEVRYKLQSMKWGLIPFWTKRNPDYGSMMKTINCRDDSLKESKGMWNTMKQRKRCVVVAQGFYEWLKKGREKVPHFVKRKDGQLMCFAGLWDCVQYEGSEEKNYTFTIITTDSNKQLKFLHDRMPVILENGSEDIRTWLDPKRYSWSKELQSLLVPFQGELEVYPVSKDVGKVGNNSPNFIIPVASSENKSNIANFFAKPATKGDTQATTTPTSSNKEHTKNEDMKMEDIKHEPGEDRKTIDHDGTEDNAPLPMPKEKSKTSIKRELSDEAAEEPPKKVPKTFASPAKAPLQKPAGRSRSATSNNTASPSKSTGKDKGSQKITSFFGK
ncbi:putative peptidase [Lachnellula subtilissima]|uniref:Putative peptidase n=1 Tax=Lachnellula subtilissima TaxID=602034 RepID=A0A8H8RTK1_9HELO|nr:putative peptidase [Lachnellula subtilissima]